MHQQTIDRTTHIAAAFVTNNNIAAGDVPGLITSIYATLTALDSPAPAPEPLPEPAVPIKRSVTNSHVTCLECGVRGKMLKRHLMTAHGMTEEQYRARWGLSPDHALVAPDYSERRRELAVQIGLGRKPGVKRKGR